MAFPTKIHVVDSVFEKKISNYLAIGLFIITVLIVAGPVSDPVNVPKLAALGLISFGLLPFIVLKLSVRENLKAYRNPLIIVLFFNLLATASTLLSKSPISQNIYGILGRNNGLIAYISMSMILISIVFFREKSSIEKILWGMFAAGLVNVFYGVIEHFFGDPIPWNNNYGALLGTFGNPDFAGAFYGMFSGLLLAFALYSGFSIKSRISALILLPLTFLCVFWTDTTQGALVTLISIAMVFLVYVHFRFNTRLLTFGYLSVVTISGLLILLGILQKGPLAAFLYKRSVSLRGVYWDAAIQTGRENFWFGVGLDSFGNWYRRARSLKAATWLPGPETITNVAHNYYLDIFAAGGILLLASYFSITCLGLYSLIKIARRLTFFDPIAASLAGLFIAFQAQAFISIPQIGLAVWGWSLIGLLYSYSNVIDSSHSTNSIKKIVQNKKRKLDHPYGIYISLGSVLGLILTIPPYSADAKWTEAINTRDLIKLESALKPTYLTPSNSDRLVNAVVILEKSNLPEKAIEYARYGVVFNPENYDSWKMLYFSSLSTSDEKSKALRNMHRLDPLNKTLDNLK